MAGKDTAIEQPSVETEEYEVPGQLVRQFCQPCSVNGKETAAAMFCSNCNEFQCTECSNGHNIYSFMKNHNLIDADMASKLHVAYDMKGLDRCVKHDKMVKFFCKDHEKLCCSTCAIIEHRKCNHVDEIKKMNVDFGERERTLKIKINELKAKGNTALKYWIEDEKKMHTQLQNVLERLTAIRTSVNKKLDEVEKDIKQQASSFSKKKKREYDQHRLYCEETVNVLKRNLDILDYVKCHGALEQQFIVQQRVNESVESTSVKASEKWSILEKIDIYLQLNPKLEALLGSTEKLASLGKITSQVNTDSIVEGMPVKLKNLLSIDLQQRDDGTEEPFYSGMDFLPDGRLVVVDNTNDKCIILSEHLERLGSFKLSNIPLGLVSVSEDEVAVTSGQTMYFLRVSKGSDIIQTRTVTTTFNCSSIRLKDNDHILVGVYDDPKPVREISFSGEEKCFPIYFPDKKFAVDDSTCTYIQSSDKVVLTDRYEHTVYIYYIKDNTRVVVKGDQIKEPCGVTIGPFDSIFVCSNGTNSIVQISQTGKILSSHKLDMKLPFSICTSKDKTKLAVSNSFFGEPKLQLFYLNI